MNTIPTLHLVLEDLLADLQHARRKHDLGRLALLAYCEVRSWARQAGQHDIADGATRMFTENPCVNKIEFLEKIDKLITALERQQQAYAPAAPSFPRADSAPGQNLSR